MSKYPFIKQIEPLPSVARLDELQTVGDVLTLADKLPAMVVSMTKGVGRQRGKLYIRFRINAPVIGLDGRQYQSAWTEVVEHIPTASLRWHTGLKTREQEILALYKRGEQAWNDDPEAARRTDCLFARLLQANPSLSNSNGETREERIWLTMFEFVRGGKPVIYIYSGLVVEALQRTFGCGWEGLRQKSESMLLTNQEQS